MGKSQDLTTQVQDDLQAPVKGVLLGESNVGGRGALGTGISVGSQGMGGALQTFRDRGQTTNCQKLQVKKVPSLQQMGH